MPPAPPRRPRRWSWTWACTGTVVRVATAFFTVAMIAMPERHVPVVSVPPWSRVPRETVDRMWRVVETAACDARRFCVVEEPGMPMAWGDRSRGLLFVGPPEAQVRAGLEILPRAPRMLPGARWRVALLCRDRGPHVLLEPLRKWLAQ